MKYKYAHGGHIKGKDIGNVLNRAFEEVMEGNVKNERPELLSKLKEWLE